MHNIYKRDHKPIGVETNATWPTNEEISTGKKATNKGCL